MTTPSAMPDREKDGFLLSHINGTSLEAPDWYRELDLEPVESLKPVVGGAAIEVLVWGKRGNPGVLLAHGSRAHARWWGPVAPLLAKHFRVASLSFSGMGGSEWRSAYTIPQQTEELFAAAEAGGLFAPSVSPVFVSHSFGARALTLAAASSRGEELAGAILVDSTIQPHQKPAFPDTVSNPSYESVAAALARFRLSPPQPCENLYLVHDIAAAGLQETKGGWRWRFDPAYYKKFEFSDVWPALRHARCRLGFLFGEESVIMDASVLAAQKREAPQGTVFVGVPLAGHHLMLDQPIAVTTSLRAIVSVWQNNIERTDG